MAFQDVGYGKGQYYSVNMPLSDGIDNEMYEYVFKKIVQEAKDKFQPDAIVLLASPSILASERINTFNVTLKGHTSCVKFVKNMNLPLLVLGGGLPATTKAVNLWTHLTSKFVGVKLSDGTVFAVKRMR